MVTWRSRTLAGCFLAMLPQSLDSGAAAQGLRPAAEFLRWKAGEWPMLILRCGSAAADGRARWYLDVTFGPHRVKAIDSDRQPPSEFGITIDDERQVRVKAYYFRFAQTVKTAELPDNLIAAMRRARTLAFDPTPHARAKVSIPMGDFASRFDEQFKRHKPACRAQ